MNEDFDVRFVWLRALAMLIMVLAACLAVVNIIGLIVSAGGGEASRFFLASLPVAIWGVVATVMFYALIRLLLAVESESHQTNHALEKINKNVLDMVQAVQLSAENALISEEAKSIAFRENDREALRGAIEEEIGKQDWESAFYLVDQLEKLFGYRQEATLQRERITLARGEFEREQLQMALARLEDQLAGHLWEQAAVQIAALQRAYPNEPAVQNLEQVIEHRKMEHKKKLLQEWDQAVKRNDIDNGIELLKELDQYLSPSEVAALEESARGVFKIKLHNLGVRFSLLVAEKQWSEALAVGKEIIQDFPNSRMSKEIRERLDALRDKATSSTPQQ